MTWRRTKTGASKRSSGGSVAWLFVGLSPRRNAPVWSPWPRSYSDYSTLQLVEAGNWYAEQFATLIDRLKAIPEGAGTVFDHKALLWLSETGTPSSHDRENIPYVLAGTLGGTLQTGRFLQVPGDRMSGDLFVTLMNAMGLDRATFGQREYAQGPIDALRA